MILFTEYKSLKEIPSNSQKRLFERFFLLESSTNAGKAKVAYIQKGKKTKANNPGSPVKAKTKDIQIPKIYISDLEAGFDMNIERLGKSQGFKKNLEKISQGNLIFLNKDILK